MKRTAANAKAVDSIEKSPPDSRNRGAMPIQLNEKLLDRCLPTKNDPPWREIVVGFSVHWSVTSRDTEPDNFEQASAGSTLGQLEAADKGSLAAVGTVLERH